MSVDIKRLLYDYRKNEVKLSNILSSLSKVTYEYPSCTPRYSTDIQGKGGLPSSQTERLALYNVMEVADKRDKLLIDKKYAEEAINLVRDAVATLNQQQRDLIDLRYFQDRNPDVTAEKMNMSTHNFWKLHKIAYEGIEKCLNGGDIETGNNPFISHKKAKILAKNVANTRVEILV